MYLVICYDVVDDGRRQRLHRRLKGYVQPVQKSIFEGFVSSRAYAGLRAIIMECIHPGEDAVRIYHLGERRRTLTDYLGVGVVLTEQPEDVIL